MALEQQTGPDRKFVAVTLPWLAAAATWVVYLLTLNHWVSLNGLLPAARTAGWTWQPELYNPLYWLVTYPFRWLPANTIPLALNLFSSICAVLTLALLARSVALLPHDRTHEQRQREQSPFCLLSIRSAWLPPVLAVMICGLQLTFWENATAASNDMFDLLLFAYVIRCLLEFRIDERQSWLTRAAFVYGAAMTNNWAMIGFLPAFLACLVWIKGVSFFSPRFLARMFLWGLAGLSLYLLLPLVRSLAEVVRVPFWPALKANLSLQKYFLSTLTFSKTALFYGDKPLWVLAVPFLLPVLIIAIRWPSYFGDTSRLGVALATWMLHFFHAFLLLVCAWVALDPQFSPRHHAPWIPLLTFYYLGALSAGYFSGYFLLVFGQKPAGRPRPVPAYLRVANTGVTCAIWLLFVLAPLALVYRNLPQIRLTNGRMLSQYAALVAQGLPAKPAVVLSDDPRRLFLVELAAAKTAKLKDCLFLDTTSLKWPDYHRFLKRKYAQRWPSDLPKARTQPFEPTSLSKLLWLLAENNTVYYLHPSFGYYFEVFYLEPHGLAYKLNLYRTNDLVAPLPSKDVITENEQFWAGVDETALKPLLALNAPVVPHSQPGLIDTFMAKAHLTKELNRDALVLAGFYSRALDFWGAEMQRNRQLPQAGAHFARALDLNPANRVAQINLQCNKNLQAGRNSALEPSQSVEDEFGKFRDWDRFMSEYGPYDEPTRCLRQGRLFVQNGLYRQAAHQFDRARSLAPDNLAAHLWLAQLYVLSRMPDGALKLVEEVRARPELLRQGHTNQTELLLIESSAYLANNDVKSAETAVHTALRNFPGDQELLATASQVFMTYGHYSNALAAINQELDLAPDNSTCLINKGYACIQLNAFDQAIPPLTRALTLQTNNYYALLNRAIAYLRSDKLDEARRDYEVLQKTFPTAFQVFYGLGEIAYRKSETNAAVRNYELYLANSPPPEEAKVISARLKQLKASSP